jgi:uncharacterized protein (TIGR02001 family)
MKKLLGLAVMAGAVAGVSGTAHAEGAFSGSVALTSDYVFRGVTQTSGNPALQGSFDYTNGLFYAGVWGSSVDFGADESVELDAYLGVTPTTGPVSWDLALIGYFYPGAGDDGAEYDYMETKVAASISPTEALSLGGALYYSPEFFGETGEALYYEVNGGFAVTEAFSVSAAYGVQDVDLVGDYATYNIGGTLALHGFEVDLRYHDTDLSGLDDVVNITLSRAL